MKFSRTIRLIFTIGEYILPGLLGTLLISCCGLLWAFAVLLCEMIFLLIRRFAKLSFSFPNLLFQTVLSSAGILAGGFLYPASSPELLGLGACLLAIVIHAALYWIVLGLFQRS